ncbi:MAG: LysR substrate-binding domain-containing protein [Pseudomonadota bacterium]
MKLTFRQIDAFKTVIQTGSITEAAKLLGISQPAVSRLIADLEEHLGFKLLQRGGRTLTPTVEARLLVEEVERALSGLERIKDAADMIRRFRHARLNIITTAAFSTMIAPPLIREFSNRFPEAAVTLEVGAADDAVMWRVSQDFDFGITTGGFLPAGMNSLPLVDRDALCVVPEDHPLASHSVIRPKDLADLSFVSYRRESQTRFEIDRVFEEAGVERRMLYEARTTNAICRLVANGLGASIIGTVDATQAAMAGCKALAFEPAIPFSAMLIWSQHRPVSAVAETFLEVVNDYRG